MKPVPKSSVAKPAPKSIKRLAIACAVTGLLAVLVLVGWRWHYARIDIAAAAEQLAATREEARQLVHMCDDSGAGLANDIAVGTSHFGHYFATDPKHALRVMTEVVMPVLDARELACSTAATDIAIVQRDGDEDPWIDAAAPKVEAALARIKQVRAAADALRSALELAAAHAELAQRLAALLAATK